MAKTYEQYLNSFQSSGVSDMNKLQSVFDTGMGKLKGADQIAFKNAFQTYKGGLNTTPTPSTQSNKSAVLSQINQGNSAAVIAGATKAMNEGRISEKQFLTVRNKARDIGFNETQSAGLAVTNSPGNLGNTPNLGNNTPPNTPTPTPTTPPATTADEAQKNVISTIQNNMTEEQRAVEERRKQQEGRITEDAATLEENKKRVEEQAKNEVEIIKERDAKTAQQEDEMKLLIDERKVRDMDEARELQRAKQAEMKAAAELQTHKDNEAQRKMEEEVEVQKLRSNWAFNKMGAAFSSAAIATSNKIAVEGAAAIAGLKVQANYNQAKIVNDAAKLEFEFSAEINRTIDKYTDAGIALKQQTIERIYNTSNSLLKTEKEKNAEITRLKENYKRDKRNIEDEMYAEMGNARDRALEQAKLLQQELLVEENRNKEKVNGFIISGGWNTMTTQQKQEYATQSGMTISEIENTKRQAIYGSAMDLMMQALGGDYIPSVAETDEIISETNRLLDAGRPLDEAVRIVTNRVIKRNPLYQQTQQLKSATISAKLSSLFGGGGGSGERQWKASDFQIILRDDGTAVRVNKVTGEPEVITEQVFIPGTISEEKINVPLSLEDGVKLMPSINQKDKDELIKNLRANTGKEVNMTGVGVGPAKTPIKTTRIVETEGKFEAKPIVVGKITPGNGINWDAFTEE